jgi:glutamate synthase (NADPH/NADH)
MRDGNDPRTYAVSTKVVLFYLKQFFISIYELFKEFITEENSMGVKILTGLKTCQVEWTKNENGAWKMLELPGSEKIYECDLCILAMGFVGPEKVFFITRNTLVVFFSRYLNN